MKNNTEYRANEKLRELGLILLGSFLYAFSLNVFLVPRGIVVGGASGLATAIGTLLSFPVGLLILIINIFFNCPWSL